MPNLSQLLNAPTRSTGAAGGMNVLRCVIRRAPASADDSLEAISQGYTAEASYEIPASNWARLGPLPSLNEACLVAIDDMGDAYLVLYASADATSSGGGPVAGDKNYVHIQNAAAATWTVTHGLGKFPSVDVVDTGDSAVIPGVHYDSANALTLSFGSPTSGKAYVN